MLKIYNSLTKQKQIFVPLEANKVNLYVCGITVYDMCHIGHARGMVFYDFLVRYLRNRGYSVQYVRNITDIDDKIIKRANENNESIEQLTERFIEAMHEDFSKLNILSPDIEPRATEYIPQMINMVNTLIDKGHAYIASSGDVLYDISSFKDYGKLAHKDLSSLQSGIRVSVTEDKKSPLDFVLWKMAKSGEPSWESPWGAGRPGWHIECSAMSNDCFGSHFDIHGGGADLKFPHHENEIAQSEAANNCSFVNYWMHVGFVTVNKEKMSKSLGNFFTIREVLEQYHPETVRYFLIASHYRSPINYSDESLNMAHAALLRLYTCLRDLPLGESLINSSFEKQFNLAIDDDFNTPQALAVLFEIAHQINSVRDTDVIYAASLAHLLRHLGNLLGILNDDPIKFMQQGKTDSEIPSEQINSLIAQREQARLEKNWQLADKIRADLTAEGIILEDSEHGTIWRRG